LNSSVFFLKISASGVDVPELAFVVFESSRMVVGPYVIQVRDGLAFAYVD
jgi:hypothetical protein